MLVVAGSIPARRSTELADRAIAVAIQGRNKVKVRPMKIYLANPRGFCAGVDRAIDIVEVSLKAYGAPIYVRHEIVHSRNVVNSLKLKGAVIVEELSKVPDGPSVT